MSRREIVALCLLLILFASGMLVTTSYSVDGFPADEKVPSSYKIVGVPLITQQKLWCGPASLTMVLNYWGDKVTQDVIGNAMDPQHTGTAYTGKTLVEYAKGRGFDVDTYSGLSTIDELKKWISIDYPVIVVQYIGVPGPYEWWSHFRVVIGYDDGTSTIYVNDPYAQESITQFSYKKFIELWTLTPAYPAFLTSGWAMVVKPKKIPTSISVSVSPTSIDKDQSMTVSGAISPQVPGATVRLTYKLPDGSTSTRTVTSASDGSFKDTYAPNIAGSWSVAASWEGTVKYGGATSSSASFTVVEKKACIIATATYGSELLQEVQFLRGFREQVVLSTFAGSQFMNVFNAWYYSFSPSVAAFVAGHPLVREVMKGIIYPLLGILHLSTMANAVFSLNSEAGVVLAGLVASIFIGAIYFSPLTIVPLLAVKKIRRRQLPRISQLKPLTIPWLISIALIIIGETAASPILMMAATGIFVIFTITLTAGTIALKVVKHL